MEVVMGHWGAWDDDALIQDKEGDRFADPDKVQRLDHQGKFFRSRGPFTVPRSPQGHPVLLQAGQSGRGKAFASRWGEVIFVIYPSLEAGKKQYREFKDAVAAAGRDPGPGDGRAGLLRHPGRERRHGGREEGAHRSHRRPIDGLTLLSEVLNYDLGRKPYDEPLTDAELAGLSWHGFRDRVIS
jgi:alkanesulfonate monooxygenase SsuD/methylene tetrahydromethanopterin reductase-like flavin-dependent oxidoreductase (luciferase family)